MDDKSPVYNSMIARTYVEYLGKNYPDIDLDSILEYAGMSRHETEDPGHWYSQHQADKFHEILTKKTGNPNISREVGRYAALSKGHGIIKKYALGFMSPIFAYLMIEKLYPLASRGATARAKKLGPNKVEVIITPEPGINEKIEQCENRIGQFEAAAKVFTGKFATIEHPSCVQKGDDCCRYIISWDKTRSLSWKRISNYSMLLGIMAVIALFFLLPVTHWIIFVLICAASTLILSLVSASIEKGELTEIIKTQGNTAKELLNETNTRYNNALLAQEIGQSASTLLEVEKLVKSVVKAIEKRLDFDRGGIWLANKEKTRLVFNVGFGYNPDIEELLKNTNFYLENNASTNVVIRSFKQRRPCLVSDISHIKKGLSERGLEFVDRIGAKSFICAPLIYKDESLGLILVDNLTSKRPLTQTDMNLLMGVASQIAISIINAASFNRLIESEEKYRSMLEANPDPVAVYDMEGRVTYLNPAFSEVFGWTMKDCLGKKMDMFVPEKNWPETNMMIKKVLNGDTFSGIETSRYTEKGDIIPVSISGSTYKNKDGKPIGSVITLRDIREQKRLESQLLHARKMETIGTLAGGVAHDLNNILSGLVSYPDLLLMDIPEDSPLRKPIVTIKKSGDKAASIVQDLLTLARRGVDTNEIVNLNTIICDYLKSPEYEKMKSLYMNSMVKTDLEKNLFNVLGSSVHLSKSVMNLISNAFEAMPEGGEIRISTENQYIDRPIRGYEYVKEGDYATLTVSDNGVGLPEGDIKNIFEPFYTKKKMGRSGTGLGMAIVWGTVKDHRGYIDVQSNAGKGTTFTLYFPVTMEEILSDKTNMPIEKYMGSGQSILVVDDVEEQREIASLMLTKLGYSVTSASSGSEAVDYIKNNQVDLIVLDMIMEPEMDGLDTYKKIIEFHPGQKAIIASGFSETGRVKETQKLGAGRYIKKPYSIEKIGLAVKDELAS
jgi:PAS domain S-box-containing protein